MQIVQFLDCFLVKNAVHCFGVLAQHGIGFVEIEDTLFFSEVLDIEVVLAETLDEVFFGNEEAHREVVDVESDVDGEEVAFLPHEVGEPIGEYILALFEVEGEEHGVEVHSAGRVELIAVDAFLQKQTFGVLLFQTHVAELLTYHRHNRVSELADYDLVHFLPRLV